MLITLIEKELKAILLSPKFVAIFAVCSILIILSIYIGVEEYNISMGHYDSVNANIIQRLKNERDWMSLSTSVIRHPDPMQVFVSGINNDIGRESLISSGAIKLYDSLYSENPIFAIFRSMDLMFIVQIVLSLFAILFTYDSISGEKETGTLKLSFSNQLPRNKYIIAKIVGSWLGLIIPLLVPLLMGVMLILLLNVPMTTTHWLKFCLLIGISGLYLSFFICIGVLISSLTKEPSNSFLYLLIIWLSLVLLIPRIGVMIAGQYVTVPTSVEISSKLFQKNREMHGQFVKWSTNHQKEMMAEGKLKQFMGEFKERQAELEQDKAKYETLLNEDWRNRKATREKFGLLLSRFSPASAFQLAAMDLTETGLSLKYKHEDQIYIYRDAFLKLRAKKLAESGSYNLSTSTPPDINEIPEFKYLNSTLSQVLHLTLIDIGIVSFYILITVAGIFIVFNRYDVR